MVSKIKSIKKTEIDSKILTYMVVKSNDLIQSKSDFNAIQHRIILFALVQIKPTDETLKPYRIKMSNIVNYTSRNYTGVRTAIKKLQGSTIKIQEKTRWVEIPFIEYIQELKLQEIYFEVCFSKVIQRFLLNLRGSYTSYTLANVVNFHKNYSLRIYELCKQYSKKGVRSITIEFLRMVLSLENNHKNFADFNRSVLTPAIDEINTHSDIFVKVKPFFNGRKVVSLDFDISKNEIKNPKFDVKGAYSKEGFEVCLKTGFDRITMRRLCILQFDNNEIDRFEKTHSNDKMINALNLYDSQTTTIKNPKGFVVKALKLGWVSHPSKPVTPLKSNGTIALDTMLKNMIKRVNE